MELNEFIKGIRDDELTELFYSVKRELDLRKEINSVAYSIHNIEDVMFSHDISVRTINALRNVIKINKIRTLGELSKLPNHTLIRQRGMGKKSLDEIKEMMFHYGLPCNG